MNRFEKWFLSIPKEILVIISVILVPIGIIVNRQVLSDMKSTFEWVESIWLTSLVWTIVFGQAIFYKYKNGTAFDKKTYVMIFVIISFFSLTSYGLFYFKEFK